MREKKPKERQLAFFDKDENWKEHWQDMPEFVQYDLTPFKSLFVHFETREDLEIFAKLVNQHINKNTKCIWFPEAELGRTANKRYAIDKYNET